MTFFMTLFLALNAFAQDSTPAKSNGEYLIKLKPNVQISAVMSSRKSASARQVATEMSSWYTVSANTQDVETLKNDERIEWIEPNYIFTKDSLPNDPKLEQLWGFRGHETSAFGKDTPGIFMEEAWQKTVGSKKVVVAVIDTGVNYKHPDLQDNMWVNEAEANGVAGVDDDKNGFIDDIHGYNFDKKSGDPMDQNGHGSHCAGTIGATGNNGIGVVGVNWDVSLMAVRFLNAGGSGTAENAVKSILYAVKMGAQVLSNSWGSTEKSKALEEAVKYASDHGVLFVAAAGNAKTNNDRKPHYPSNYAVTNLISVAALSSSGGMASFSNFGKKTVHLGAPGVAIYSTSLKDKYASLDGTSMATPHVAGVAALVLSRWPNMTATQVKARLMQTVTPLKGFKDRVISGGIVNAAQAVADQ